VTGVDLSSLTSTQSNDPTSGMQLLAGADQVTTVGSDTVRGAVTTHYRVTVDLKKAVQAAPPAARAAVQKLVGLYAIPTLPVDVWIDGNERIRRESIVMDPLDLTLPVAATGATGKITITVEFYNFGAPVDTAPPPSSDVSDLSNLLGGSTPTPGPTPSTAAPSPGAAPTPATGSAAKSRYVAQANALCQTMNTKVSAVPDPGSDPTAMATALSQVEWITAATVVKLRALPPAPGDAATVAAIYAKVDVFLADMTAEINALRAGNQSLAQSLDTKLNTDGDAANAASNAYGLTVCGS